MYKVSLEKKKQVAGPSVENLENSYNEILVDSF